jgi:hypothetical protein
MSQLPTPDAHFELNVRFEFHAACQQAFDQVKAAIKNGHLPMTSTFSGWSQWGPISLLRDVVLLPKQIWRPVVTVRIPVATIISRNSCPPSTRMLVPVPLVHKSTALELQRLLKHCRHTLLSMFTIFIRLTQIDTQSTTLHRNAYVLQRFAHIMRLDARL